MFTHLLHFISRRDALHLAVLGYGQNMTSGSQGTLDATSDQKVTHRCSVYQKHTLPYGVLT